MSENRDVRDRWYLFSRAGLALIILLSGLALIPFTSLRAEELTWRLFANIYQPDLSVNDNSGRPGSAFLFTGSGYPPLAAATIYIDGRPLGGLTTDSSGGATFLLRTDSLDPPGRYFITLATDANTSDTRHIDLEPAEPLVPPPPNYDGPRFRLNVNVDIYLPLSGR